MSPAIEHKKEMLNYSIAIADMDLRGKPHLREREERYVGRSIHTGGILVIRETEEGWWKQEFDIANNAEKQLEKLIGDPTVAYGWIITPRFRGRGGWNLDDI